MQVSEKGKQPVEWRPTIKLWPMSNHPPKVAGDDPVGWKRFRVIPFDRVFDAEHADPTLGDRLRTPAMRKAVLRWLVEGAHLWYAQGLPQPQAVTQATREAALANDSAARFAEECLQADETASALVADLHAAYMTWCEDEGVEDRDRKNKVHFARALSRGGYTQDGYKRWKAKIRG